MRYIESIAKKIEPIFGKEAVKTAVSEILNAFCIEAGEPFDFERHEIEDGFGGLFKFSDKTKEIWLYIIDKFTNDGYLVCKTKEGCDDLH